MAERKSILKKDLGNISEDSFKEYAGIFPQIEDWRLKEREPKSNNPKAKPSDRASVFILWGYETDGFESGFYFKDPYFYILKIENDLYITKEKALTARIEQLSKIKDTKDLEKKIISLCTKKSGSGEGESLDEKIYTTI